MLDPFCGCATTCVAADDLGRDWVGIDISDKAADLVVDRIADRQGLYRNIVHRLDIPIRTDLGRIPRYILLLIEHTCTENKADIAQGVEPILRSSI